MSRHVRAKAAASNIICYRFKDIGKLPILGL